MALRWVVAVDGRWSPLCELLWHPWNHVTLSRRRCNRCGRVDVLEAIAPAPVPPEDQT